MKKLYLSASIAALLAAGSVQATEVYNKDGNTVDVGGYISLQALSMPTLTDAQKKTVKPMGFGDNGSRFNLGFGHDLGNGWKSMGKIEYAFNGTGEKFTSTTGVIESEGENFTNRLAYLAFGHGTYGTVYVGKTWGTFSDVASVTETGAVYAPVWGMYGLDDGSWEGTGRAKNVIQYRVTIPAANNMRLGLQYQPVASGEYAEEEFTSKFGGGFGLSLVVPVMPELELGVAYQLNSFEHSLKSDLMVGASTTAAPYDKGANAMAVSVKYGSFEAPGFHMGLTYSSGENLGKLPTGLAVRNKDTAFNTGVLSSAPKSNQIAVVGSFNVNKFVPFVGYYMTTFESEDGVRDITISDATITKDATGGASTLAEKATSNSLVVGAHYLWSDNFSIFAEYSMDMTSEITTKDDGGTAAAVLTDDGKKHYETTNSPHGFTMGFKFVF